MFHPGNKESIISKILSQLQLSFEHQNEPEVGIKGVLSYYFPPKPFPQRQ